MMRLTTMLMLIGAALAVALMPGAAQHSPYAGQDRSAVKALNPAEIDDLLAGRGMGLAKAAELNSYPGPAHALDLADALQLSDGQRASLTAIKARMSEQAIAVGQRLIGLESALDRAFASGAIDATDLEGQLRAIGALQAELRGVHLRAHVATRDLLSPTQIAQYNKARGYDGPQSGGHKH